MNRWNGKVALVTGASSGIGREICKVLAKDGMHVVGCARRMDRLQELAKEIASEGRIFTALSCDLSKEEDIHSLFSQIKKKYGGVDVCINSAAFSYNSSLMDGTVSEWRKVLDVNVTAVCLCTQLAIKSIIERKSNTGHIININSMSGHRVAGSSSVHFYSASKYAMTSFTEGFRQELREMKSNIKITSVSPGLVETEFEIAKNSRESAAILYASMKCLQAEDIAKVVRDVLNSHPRAEINEVMIRPTEQIS